MIKMKENKGITLVALIITIIILLILAGVTLSLVIGENGLIAKSKQSAEKYKDKAKQEEGQLEDFETGMEKIGLDELQDEEENPELKPMKLVLNITEENTKIELPINKESDEYNYDCTVKWGDDTEDKVTNENVKNVSHTYEKKGMYTLTITGIFENIYTEYWQNNNMLKALVKVIQWGKTELKHVQLAGCENLIELAEPSKNSFINIKSFFYSFRGDTSLKEIPQNLFANCPDVTSFGFAFSECSSLTSIPKNLFANCPNVDSFNFTFSKCSSLTSVPEDLFANCPNVTRFDYAFVDCINLKGKSIQLWNEEYRQAKGITRNSGGEGCYANCENLDDYADIPDYWKMDTRPV